jgi:large subunit ribosomal protein L23
MAIISDVIIRPLLTEKASVRTEKENRYGFEVKLAANKHQIRQAVESLYDVKVLNVKTTVAQGKDHRYGRFVAKSSKRKMAYVQLAEGQTIKFFKGV